jgi:hypothetical protein
MNALSELPPEALLRPDLQPVERSHRRWWFYRFRCPWPRHHDVTETIERVILAYIPDLADRREFLPQFRHFSPKVRTLPLDDE